MDDPLRVVVQDGKLFARIESGRAYGTEGVALTLNQWYHVAAVKRGNNLTLFVDGQPVATASVPTVLVTNAADFAVGGNPHFSGSEFLPGKLADLKFYARALTADEVNAIAASLADGANE
jgi:hypothetical protein